MCRTSLQIRWLSGGLPWGESAFLAVSVNHIGRYPNGHLARTRPSLLVEMLAKPRTYDHVTAFLTDDPVPGRAVLIYAVCLVFEHETHWIFLLVLGQDAVVLDSPRLCPGQSSRRSEQPGALGGALAH